MGFSFLEYFYTNKYDNEIIIKTQNESFSVSKIKKIVSCQVQYLNSLDTKDIQINTEDYFDFIIIFLACIFANKHIWVTNNNSKNKTPKNTVEISKLSEKKTEQNEFTQTDTENIQLTFYTSGSTSEPKLVKKTLKCLFNESYDIIANFEDLIVKKHEFITSTPINHLFAITFFIFAALNSKGIINTTKINYPEDLNLPNAVFITTPSFMSYMQKHNIKPTINPEYTISAGSVLHTQTHKFFEEFSKIINIYGSTETGVIAHKEHSNGTFKLFDGIKILATDQEGTKLLSNYANPKEVTVSDKIALNENNSIEFLGRNDRVFKIQEKRISAEELEKELKNLKYVKDCYIVNLDNKIGVLVALNSLGSQYFIQNGSIKLTKFLKSKLIKNFAIIPQKWKYIDVIPRNTMGKFDSSKIKELFSINLSLPYILNRTINQNTAEFELFFYKNCNFFKGHFDEFSIVAGVVQLYYASYFSKIAFGETCHTGQIRRIKFSNIIHPNTIVKLKLTLSDKNITYEYYNENTSYSSACLPLSNNLEEK